MAFQNQTRAASGGKRSPQSSRSSHGAPAKRQQDKRSSGYQPKDGTGALFFDAPGAPTMSGSITYGATGAITLEPALDRNQREYQKISGDGVSGALYPNERKQEDRHPDFTGPIEIDGEKLRVSAWQREIRQGAKAGEPYLSLAISQPYRGG